MRVDPKSLVRRLNLTCRKALEAGVGLAVARSHYEVTLEHVMRKLLDETGGDIAAIFRHYDVHAPRIISALDTELEQMSKGNTGRPVFSPLLFTWIQDAFLIAAAEQGASTVRSGHLLASLLARPGRSGIDEHTDELLKIDPDVLRRELTPLVEGTSEDEPEVGDAPHETRAAARAAGEEALTRFTVDVTARAADGEIDPVLARDHEIRQLIDVLTRRRKNNPILIGEAGVGKTAVVEGLALRLAVDDVPEALRGVRILNLDLGLLQAGAGVKGEFENRLKQVIHEVKTATVPTILFIDEAHTLIGAGGAAGGGDAAQLLKPALARGELKTVAATTFGEYKKYIEKDAALERRFQPITVAEPSVEDATVMLRGVKTKFERHHGVHVLDEAVEAAVRLSDRYVTGRLLPDKAIDLLDTACARVAVGQTTKPGQLDDLERRIAHFETAIAAIERDQHEALADRSEEREALLREQKQLDRDRARLQRRWKKQRAVVEKLRGKLAGRRSKKRDDSKLRKAVAKLAKLQEKGALVHLHVDSSVVAQIVSDWTGVPLGDMVRDELTRLLALEADLGKRVVGQDEAIQTLARRIRASKASLSPPQQPIGVFLLVGPSGVGKTETGLALAEQLFGGERSIVTVNMSEFMEKHTVSRLIGSPPGYVGYGEGGVLTEAVRHRPYSVVLLDEVEKAHPEVMNIFHQVFDKGVLADGEGRVVDFKNTVIVMTSNLGTEAIVEACAESAEAPPLTDLVERVRPALLKRFRAALLGRMTVIPYVPLSDETMGRIVDMKLERIRERMERGHGVDFRATKAARATILARCDDPSSGARSIDHVLDQSVLPRISEQLLEQMAVGEAPERLTLGVGRRRELVPRFSSPARAAKQVAAAEAESVMGEPAKENAAAEPAPSHEPSDSKTAANEKPTKKEKPAANEKPIRKTSTRKQSTRRKSTKKKPTKKKPTKKKPTKKKSTKKKSTKKKSTKQKPTPRQ